HASRSAPAKYGPDPELSRTSLSIVDCRLMRLFLFRTREGIRSRLLQPQNQIINSPDYVGPVPHFRNLDMVQPRVRRRLADRSRLSFAGASRSAVLHVGPTIPVRCRSILCPGFWESHRATYHIASLPLSSLAAPKGKAKHMEKRKQGIPEKRPDVHPFSKPPCHTRASNCRL